MSTENTSILSHISLGTNNIDRAAAFYDKVLATLDCKQLMKYPGQSPMVKSIQSSG